MKQGWLIKMPGNCNRARR